MRSLIASGWRFWLIAGTISVCFFAVVARLWWVQVHTSAYYMRFVEDNRNTSHTVRASRGKITDSRGNVLAQNRVVWNICADPQEMRDIDRAQIPAIAKILEIPEDELRSKLEPRMRTITDDSGKTSLRNVRWVLLKKEADEKTLQAVTKLLPRVFRENGKKVTRNFFPIYGERKFIRSYPLGKTAAHVIGYVNREGKAACGIEAAMDFYLKGSDGWIESKNDGRGREMPRLRFRDVPATDGATVQLTLDAAIQGFAEDACAEIEQKYSPEAATIIVSEAATGRILALANTPTFDLNEFNSAPMENQRNRAATDVYEPGSVFKIVTVAAALEEGVVTENSVFDCGKKNVPMKSPYRGKMRALPNEDHDMGEITVHGVIRQSSNRGVAQIAMKFCETPNLGEQAYVDYVRKFGFGEATQLLGIGNAEQRGTVHAPRKWDGLTITRMPMGHAIDVTPLQTHMAMSVIASGGLLLEPQLVRRVATDDGKEILRYEPRVRRRVVSEKTAELLTGMLRDVCSPAGTAKEAAIPGFNVAGKTGTSQKIINGKYSNDTYVASFSGFFPAENPRLVITVVIDTPTYYAERWIAQRDANGHVMRYPNGTMKMEKKLVRTRAYGGKIAAPVFKEIAQKAITWLELSPNASVPENSARTNAGTPGNSAH